MTQTQFLLFLIAIIPLLNCLIIKLCVDSPFLINFANKFSPITSIINLIGLYGSMESDSSYLTLTEALRGISLGFSIDKITLGFLFLLDFFWLVFAFYSQRFLQASAAKNANDLQFFFTLIIAFVNLIVISKNLLSTLFFYNCLILLCHFFALKFLHKTETKFSRFFTFLLYLESLFFFLAAVATYKFTAQIDFVNGGIISENFDHQKHSLLLFFYLSGLFLSVLAPCYLLYRNINLEPITIYIFFFLAYAFSSLYIFVKLLHFIFGFKGFSILIEKIGFDFFGIIFLANAVIASTLLLLSKGIKSSFFYLFFHQFIFAIFSTFLFATFNDGKIYLALFSFFLSFTLVFLAISNLVLYLSSAQNKRLDGLFYDLIVTISLLTFGIANMAGVAPGIGGVEKFFLLKIILQKKMWLALSLFLLNILSLVLFFWKMFWPFFIREKEVRAAEDLDLAKNIDFDSSLILTALTVAVVIFLGLILFPFLTNFFL